MKFLIIHDEIHDLLKNIKICLQLQGHETDFFHLKDFQFFSHSGSIFDSYDAIYFDRPEEKSKHFMQQILLLEASNLNDKILNSPIPYSIFRNKASGTIWLKENGFPVPETIVTESLNEALKFAQDHVEVMCKPVYGHSGNGIFGFHTSQAPIELLKERLSSEGLIYLQRFISTSPAHDLRVEMVEEEIVYSFFRIKVTSESYPCCNIAQGATHKLVQIEDSLAKELHQLMKRSKLTVAGIDLIWCEKNKRYLYVEVNPEPTQADWQPEFSEKIASTLIKKAQKGSNYD